MRLAYPLDGAARPEPGYFDAGAVTIGELLPAVYQEYDQNALRFTAGLDRVLAPVWLAVDCYDAYLHPGIAPDDVVAWLAGWVGVVVDDNWHDEQLRRLVANAFELYRWRGTAKGIADLVEAYTGVRPEVDDSGGVAVSADAGSGSAAREELSVVLRFPAGVLSDDEMERLTALVAASTPAHVTPRVETV